jgi:hypothetical protein
VLLEVGNRANRICCHLTSKTQEKSKKKDVKDVELDEFVDDGQNHPGA